MSHIIHRCCCCSSCCYPCRCVQEKVKAIDEKIRQLQLEKSRLLGYGYVFVPTMWHTFPPSPSVAPTITCDDVVAQAKK